MSIRIVGVSKRFGSLEAVKNVSLEIRTGEFFTLLGPSGCGKTTLLRSIAGFNQPETGEIYFGDKRIDRMAAHKRGIGMVFQNYAVFPHLTVGDNVAYGLKARKVPSGEIGPKGKKALQMVRLGGMEDRLPNQLSGGQLQRVAIARALVIEPQVLLMDEPLSNLDAKLRVEMRGEIRELQRQMGITTVYVTHDQEEALSISDRIAVMNLGVVEQVGMPWEIYNAPVNRFVAGFIGTTNFFEGKWSGEAGIADVEGVRMRVPATSVPGRAKGLLCHPARGFQGSRTGSGGPARGDVPPEREGRQSGVPGLHDQIRTGAVPVLECKDGVLRRPSRKPAERRGTAGDLLRSPKGAGLLMDSVECQCQFSVKR